MDAAQPCGSLGIRKRCRTVQSSSQPAHASYTVCSEADTTGILRPMCVQDLNFLRRVASHLANPAQGSKPAISHPLGSGVLT